MILLGARGRPSLQLEGLNQGHAGGVVRPVHNRGVVAFPGVPEVVLSKLASQTHSISSPTLIVTVLGEKLSPLAPTPTATVLACNKLVCAKRTVPSDTRIIRQNARFITVNLTHTNPSQFPACATIGA